MLTWSFNSLSVKHRLLIVFPNSFDLDKDRQNVGPYLDLNNSYTLIVWDGSFEHQKYM